MGERLLIIGRDVAGLYTAVIARSQHPDAKIKLITPDQHVGYMGYDLPDYIGCEKELEDLLEKGREVFSRDFRIQLETGCTIKELYPQQKRVLVQRQGLDEFEEEYDALVLATGFRPRYPDIDGTKLKNVFFIYRLEDALEIRQRIDRDEVRQAIVVGGDLLGMKVVENLICRDIPVTLVESREHILPGFGMETADLVRKYMEGKGIEILTGEKVLTLIGNAKGEVVEVHTPNHILEGDLVIWTSDMEPDVEPAKAASVEIGKTGAIAVDQTMQTNIPHIYAVGACAEVRHLITGRPVWNPASSLSFQMGYIAGRNVFHSKVLDSFSGALGTETVNILGMTVAKTGLSVAEAEEAGYLVESDLISSRDCLFTQPGHKEIIAQLIVDKDTHRLLGAQFVGEGISDQVVDVLVAAISLGGNLEQLSSFCYSRSPLTSPAIAVILTAADVLLTKLSGKIESISPTHLHEMIDDENLIILDVRSLAEVMLGAIPGSVHIPLTELESRIGELKQGKTVVLICNSVESMVLASRILRRHGFEQVKLLDGGIAAYPYELT